MPSRLHRKTILPMCALLMLVSVGCGRDNDTQQRAYGVRSMDPQQRAPFVMDRNDNEIDRQAPAVENRDITMGRNQNPNLIIGHPGTRGYQVDVSNMRMMAKSVPGVEDARITLNGSNAFVTLDLVRNVTAAQTRSIERQVIQSLTQKVPRYDFHITSNDGYHRGGK
ncbi:sporulation protein [Brevibacillus migulae]|uniref:sporulation protein n=1 Tax=Brevibacillus migulae TaxID=1644114 RepID=UPI00106E6200|nr:sporulation protein [Brevibacillus migulae]